MRRLVRRIFDYQAAILRALGRRIYQTPNERRCMPWFAAQGDKTLRLNYDLDRHSLVFDVGGYDGQWASDIFVRYCCSINVFEPVQAFAAQIERRFAKNKKIVVYRHGLANETRTASIYLGKDDSSIFKQGIQSEEIQLVRAIDFIEQNGIQTIQLMKINIEGGEYDLLEHLIDTGFVRHIQDIQVQFHDFVPDAQERMIKIKENLERTHFLTYQYPFVWENWRRRDSK